MVAIRTLCVFCGSSSPADSRYRDTARALGELLAGTGVDLVYGGGRAGLMGEIADAALAAGGRVFGVIPAGPAGRALIQRADTPKDALAVLASARPAAGQQWLTPGER